MSAFAWDAAQKGCSLANTLHRAQQIGTLSSSQQEALHSALEGGGSCSCFCGSAITAAGRVKKIQMLEQ